MSYLEVHLPNGQVEHFELSKASMVVGRSPEADIRVHLPIVSRQQARIDRLGKNRWIIHDLGSRNKTRVDNRSVKSHVLTNKDIVFFGSIKAVFHDPSGASNQPMAVPKEKPQKAEPKKAASSETIDIVETRCPECSTVLDEGAVLCVKCGYSFKTGRRFELSLGEGVSSGPGSPKSFEVGSGVKKPAKAAAVAVEGEASGIQIDWYQIKTYILPVAFIVLFLALSVMQAGIAGGIMAVISIVVRVAFLLVAMTIAAKLAEFGFGEFGPAILQTFGIAAALALAPMLVGGLFMLIFYLPILWLLLYLFFGVDFFEAFLIIMIMGTIESFLMTILMSAFASLLSGGGGY